MTAHSQVATPNASGQYPPEPKVVAATAGAYVLTFLTFMVANFAKDVDHALVLGTMPEWLETVLAPLIPAAAAYVNGSLPKHQHRRPALTGGTATL